MMDDAKVLMGGHHGWKSRLARCVGVHPDTAFRWKELPPPVKAFVVALSYVPAADREHVIRLLEGR